MNLVAVTTAVATLGRGGPGVSSVSSALGVALWWWPIVSSALDAVLLLWEPCATSIATAAATPTGRPRNRDTNFDSASIKLGSIERLLSSVSFLLIAEGDEAVAAGAAGVTVADHNGVENLAVCFESLKRQNKGAMIHHIRTHFANKAILGSGVTGRRRYGDDN